MSERRKLRIQIIPRIHDIEEIKSVVVKLNANSKSLARSLGCNVNVVFGLKKNVSTVSDN